MGSKRIVRDLKRRYKKEEVVYNLEETKFSLAKILSKVKEPTITTETMKEETKELLRSSINFPASLHFQGINYKFWDIKMNIFLKAEELCHFGQAKDSLNLESFQALIQVQKKKRHDLALHLIQ